MKKFIIFLLLLVIFTFAACAKNKRTTPESSWDRNVATLSSYQVTPNITNVQNMTKSQALENVRKVLNLDKWKDESTEEELNYSGRVVNIQKYKSPTQFSRPSLGMDIYETVDKSYDFKKQFFYSDIRQIDIIVKEDSDKLIASRCAVNPFLCPMFLYLDSTDGRPQIFICRITLRTGQVEDYNFQNEYDSRLLADSLMVLAKQNSSTESKANSVMVSEKQANATFRMIDGPLPEMKFAYIAPGTFMMGSHPYESPSWAQGETQHRVTLARSFYLMTTEVTQALWQAVMGNNPSHFKNCGAECPVENVSWKEVQVFIRRLNQQVGVSKYRLPTEAEWEYAARAGSPSEPVAIRHCEYDSDFDNIAWYCGNSDRTTHPVGRKRANAWGLYDMHGNVNEWCQDLLDYYPREAVTDPIGPASGGIRDGERVVRGGCWSDSPQNCRSAQRRGRRADTFSASLGFRLAADY